MANRLHGVYEKERGLWVDIFEYCITEGKTTTVELNSWMGTGGRDMSLF